MRRRITGLRARLAVTDVVPPRDALLLLPQLPATAAVAGSMVAWTPALAAWGVHAEPLGLGAPDPAPELAVGHDAAQLAASGAATVLLIGRGRERILAAGYRVTDWQVGRTLSGTTALVPAGRSPVRRVLRTGGGPRRPRQVAADLADRLLGRATVTVGAHDPPRPWLLGPDVASAGLLLGTASARRLPVFAVADAHGRLSRVIKVGFGPLTAERFEAEQRTLASLGQLSMPGVPLALGAGGDPQGVVWSAESAVPGTPLLDVLPTMPAAAALARLERVADWLADLAGRTAGTRAPDSSLRLHSGLEAARALLPPPGDVPGVLIHADLEHNVLLDGDGVGVIDWEKARPGGLPLHDLLPLLLKGLIQLRRVPHAETLDFLREVLHGDGPDGTWLRATVRTSLARTGVDVEHAGALVGLSLASWASRHHQHDDLLVTVGGRPARWRSPAVVLAPEWLSRPELGARWPAIERP